MTAHLFHENKQDIGGGKIRKVATLDLNLYFAAKTNNNSLQTRIATGIEGCFELSINHGVFFCFFASANIFLISAKLLILAEKSMPVFDPMLSRTSS